MFTAVNTPAGQVARGKPYSDFGRAPGNHSLNHVIILDCSLAKIGVEAKILDRQGEVGGPGHILLRLPSAVAFNQATTG